MDSTTMPLPTTGPLLYVPNMPMIAPLMPEFDSTGPVLVGIILNWFLYGILLMQYYLYLNSERKDNKYLRAIVYFLLLLDTVQTILTMYDAFYWFIYNFGDYSQMYISVTTGVNSPVMDAVIAFIVQLVYCWRLWVLGKWKVIPAATAFLALVGCVSGVVVGVNAAIIKNMLLFKPKFIVAVYLWCFSSAVTDIAIAGSMAYLLLKFRSEDTSRRMIFIIKRIVLLTLETNAMTAAIAIAIIPTFVIQSISPPFSNVYMPFGFLLGKSYSNCFMVLLNQRPSYEDNSHSHLFEGSGLYFGSGAQSHPEARSHAIQRPSEVGNDVPAIQSADGTSQKRNSPVATEMSVLKHVKNGAGRTGSQNFV